LIPVRQQLADRVELDRQLEELKEMMEELKEAREEWEKAKEEWEKACEEKFEELKRRVMEER